MIERGAVRERATSAELRAVAPAVALVLLLFGGALLLTLGQSLGRMPLVGEAAWSGRAYGDILARTEVGAALRYSLWLAAASTLAATLVGLGAALLLRRAIRGRRPVIAALQLVLPLPYAVAAVMMLLMLAQSGLLARLAFHVGWIDAPSQMPALLFDRLALGVIATYAWKGGAFVAVIVLAAMQRGGEGAHDVARTLGASAGQRVWHVTLPAIAPQLGAAAALVFAFTFGAFEVPFLLGPTSPQALPVLAWRAFGDLDLGRRDEAAAIGVLIALVAALVLVAGRALARGRRSRAWREGAKRAADGAMARPLRRWRAAARRAAARFASPPALRGRAPLAPSSRPAVGGRRPDRLWRLGARAFRVLSLAALGVTLALPVVPLALWSVSGAWRWPDLWPARWSLAAWMAVLSPGGRAMGALADSLAVSALAASAALLVALPAGRALARAWRGRDAVEALLLAPALVPPVAVAMGLQAAFSRMGIVDTIPAVSLAHLVPVLPYVTLLIAAACKRLSPEWEAQARTLGAGRWARLRHVALPLLGPSVALAGAFGFLVSWSQYLFTLMIGGGRVVTLPLQLYAYVGAGQYGRASALAWLFLAPPLLLLALLVGPLSAEDVAADGVARL